MLIQIIFKLIECSNNILGVSFIFYDKDELKLTIPLLFNS